MAKKTEKAVRGAATGAMAGAALGPWGAAGGAVIGGALGYFSGDDKTAPAPPPTKYIDMSESWGTDPSAYAAPTNQLLGPQFQDDPEYQRLLQEREDLGGQTTAWYQSVGEEANRLYPGTDPGSQAGKAAFIQNKMKPENAPPGIAQAINRLNLNSTELDSRREYVQETSDLYGLTGRADAAGKQQAQQADFASAGMPGRFAQMQSREMQLGQANNLLTNDQSGAGQNQLIGRLYEDMNGGQPSVAQIQLNQGAQSALQQQAAIAASSSPMNAAFAQKQAAMQGANVMGNLNQQQALLRAQEYAGARGQLGDVLNQQRQQHYLGQQTASGVMKDARGQDLTSLSYDYNNELQNAQLRAQQQQANSANQQFYVGQYMNEQARRQQQAIQGQQFNAGQNLNAATTNANVSVGAGGVANGAGANAISQQAQDDRRTGTYINAGAQAIGAYQQFNGATATPAANGYMDPTIKDPWGKA